MSNHNLIVRLEPGFDTARFPLPKYNVALTVPTAYPLPIW